MTNETASDDHRLAVRLFLAVLVVVLAAALAVAVFGLPALGLIGIVLTLVMFVLMLSFTAGN